MGNQPSCNIYQELLDDKYHGYLTEEKYNYIKDDQYTNLLNLYKNVILGLRKQYNMVDNEKNYTHSESAEFKQSLSQLDDCLKIRYGNVSSRLSAPTKKYKTLVDLIRDAYEERKVIVISGSNQIKMGGKSKKNTVKKSKSKKGKSKKNTWGKK